MRRGTKVGQAYVALTVDGSGVNDQIVDSIEDVDYEHIGRKANKDFEKGWSNADRARAKRLVADAREDMEKAVANISRAVEHDTTIGKAIRTQLKKSFNNGDLDELFRAAGKHVGYEFGSGLDRQFKEAIVNTLNEMQQEVSRRGGSLNLFRREEDSPFLRTTEEFDRLAQSAHNMLKRYEEDWEDAIAEKLRREKGANTEIWKVRNASAKAHAQYLRMLDDGRINPYTGADIRRESALQRSVGRMFGAGSRNNFLNLIGRTMGNVAGLTEKASRFASGFADGMARASDNANMFQKIMSGFKGGSAASGLLGVFRTLVASGPAAIVVAVALLGTLSALASVAGALIGIVTGLAATIATALTGALFVGAGAIMAVVAAGGLLTAAFMSMTNAQREALTSAFQPLKAEMVGIGQLMITQMIPYFDKWSQNLQKALLLAAPVASVMGRAFGEAGEIISRAFSGPGFQNMSIALGQYLPSIVRRLSSAFGGFLNGVMGMFAVLMPYVNRFAGYLNQVATRFSNWANSASGRNSIEDFVERAFVSIRSLWNALREIGGFITDVLFSPEAQNAGNTMFDSIARTFNKFRKAVSEASRNGDLKRWFDDAIEFGGRLWELVEALTGSFFALYNSGILQTVGAAIKALADMIKGLNRVLAFLIDMFGVMAKIPSPFGLAISGVRSMIEMITELGNRVRWVGDLFNRLLPGDPFGKGFKSAGSMVPQPQPGSLGAGNVAGAAGALGNFTIPGLKGAGNAALDATYEKWGGNMPNPTKMTKEWQNPYVKWANQLLKQAPKLRKEIRAALREVNKAIFDGILDALKDTDPEAVASSMNAMAERARDLAQSGVEKAEAALQSAAQNLANATTKKQAKKALKEIKQAQKDIQIATDIQNKINAAAAKAAAQGVQYNYYMLEAVGDDASFAALNRLRAVHNRTLADIAASRGKAADLLEDANRKLEEAVRLRDDYQRSVIDSINSFGSLLTAQARVVNGVEQALTAADITDNLEKRLEQIRSFQSNLNHLLTLGLSNDAYKQLVDAGVEQGGAFAQALVDGDIGAIQHMNQLVSQIDSAAGDLGQQASDRLYQAGVSAAQGLVDGLTSLSAELDRAAHVLGATIARSIANSLGISSPSRVLIAMMEEVGNGAVIGLDNQTAKVVSASSRLAGNIAVSPEVASYAAQHGTSPTVSGNGPEPRFVWTGDIVTPTEDPHAVATETLNELAGRLP